MKPRIQIFNYNVIRNAADASVLDMFIDGDIMDEPTREMYQEWCGDNCSVSFKSVRNQILNSGAKTINITINSGGGSVTDAMAIHDMIVDCQENKGMTVNTIGMGIVASAATYILMAGKNSTISANSWFMIHNVAGYCWGDVNEIENYTRTLRNFNNSVVKFYAKVTGKDEATITQLMNEETWMTGEQACTNGFVKNCSGTTNFKNAIKPEKWPFSNTAVLNMYNSAVTAPPAPKNENSNQPENKKGMKKNKIVNAITEAFKKLNLNNDANLSTVKVTDLQNAISNALAEQEDDDVDQAAINNMVNTAMTQSFNNLFAAALTNTLGQADNGITKLVNTAVTTATEKLVTNSQLDEVVTDIATKLGGPKNRKIGVETPVNAGDIPEDAGGVSWS